MAINDTISFFDIDKQENVCCNNSTCFRGSILNWVNIWKRSGIGQECQGELLLTVVGTNKEA